MSTDTTSDSLEAADARVLNRIRLELQDDLSLIEMGLLTTMHGLGQLSRKGKYSSGPQILRATLLVRCFNTGNCAYRLLRMGYYVQPLVLLRSAFEDWIAENYVQARPHQASKWMDQSLTRPSRAKQVEAVTTDKKANLKGILGTLDEFAHPGRMGVWQIAEERETGPYLRLGGHYDAAWFSRVAYPFLFLLSLKATSITRLMTDVAVQPESEWIGEANEFDARGTAWVKQYNDSIGD